MVYSGNSKNWEMVRSEARIRALDARRHDFMARRLKRARLKSGLSQEAVGRMMGKNQLWVCRAERSGNVTSVEVERLAAIFDVGLEFFRTLKQEKTRTPNGYMDWTNAKWCIRARAEAATKVVAAHEEPKPRRKPAPGSF